MLASSSLFDLSGFAHASLFQEAAPPWEALLHLAEYMKRQPLGRIEVDIPEGVFLVHPELISIGKGTRLEPGAYIAGPCIIGTDCQVRHGAYLRGDVLVGNRCIIGHATEIKHSILLDGAAAPHFNYVGDSILGKGVNLGAGVVCANLRLDHGFVSVQWEGKKITTSLKKLGALIGDGAQVGCHCVLNPGTILGRGSLCFPCLNVAGYIPENGKVTSSQPNRVRG